MGRSADGGAGTATLLGDGLWAIDLGFQGQAGVIAVYLLAGNGEVALIETGPASTLPALRAGIRAAGFDPADVGRALVTHIHLDHSGAAGVLAREAPALAVSVHPLGAPHLLDPTRLVASAGRLYGDRMDTLWGEVAPLPAERVVPLADGESVAVAGRVLTAIYTPGHAAHHVAFWDAAAGIAFTGDAGGVRVQRTGYVCPPTPPPEFDPVAWADSVARLRGLGARRLCPTHFGAFDDAGAHLAQIVPNLDALQALAADAIAGGADASALTDLLHAHLAARLAGAPPAALSTLEWASPSYVAAPGLLRYLIKRGVVPA